MSPCLSSFEIREPLNVAPTLYENIVLDFLSKRTSLMRIYNVQSYSSAEMFVIKFCFFNHQNSIHLRTRKKFQFDLGDECTRI